MSDMVYSWKAHSQISLDPVIAGKRLERIREQCGGSLIPANVLEDARKKNSPLHRHFEWNDNAAAEQHRLQQAGQLIRALVVEVRMESVKEPIQTRAFVSVKGTDDKPKYTGIVQAMSDADYRAQIVAQAWKDLLSWRDRYQQYNELSAIFSAIDKARETEGLKAVA